MRSPQEELAHQQVQLANQRVHQLAAAKQAHQQVQQAKQRVQHLAVSRSIDQAQKVKVPVAGSVVKSKVLGQLEFWDEDKAFGFIRTPGNERVFCHTSGFSAECNLKDFVKFDIWRSKGSSKLNAINVTPQQCTCIVLAKDQIGAVEQQYALIRGACGQAFQCSEADFKEGSFRRRDEVRFDGVWNGRFKAVNVRHARVDVAQTEKKPEVAQKVVKTERSRWSTEEWKAWQRPVAEQAEDASTVASLSLDTMD
jgi:cold shock CspA family protein